MARAWNGSDLETELSALLGDTSTAFKARVLGWINDTQEDIANSHDWNFLIRRGEKVLTASSEQQSVETAAPGAASVAQSAGGTLTDAGVYNVYVTYVESNGLESVAGTVSADITISGTTQQIDVTAIPVSGEPLVTQRKIYLQLDSGAILFVSTINDNTTTTATILADATSTIEAPDFSGLRKFRGNPFFESSSQLDQRSLDDLRLKFQGAVPTGTPEFWAPLADNEMFFYPAPSSALTLKYYFHIRPPHIYSSVDSQPLLPVEFKPVLKAGVISLGYEYRDRAGQEGKLNNYHLLLSKAQRDFSEKARGRATVRDVVGDTDGFSYN